MAFLSHPQICKHFPAIPSNVRKLKVKTSVTKILNNCPHNQYLCREATEKPEPEVHHGEGKVLVEEIAEETAHA